MGTIPKILVFAGGLFFAVAFIGIAANLFQPGADAAKSAQSDFSNTAAEIQDQKYLIFDDTQTSGSQVMNAIRRFQREGEAQAIGLYVETGKNTQGTGLWYYNEFTGGSLTQTNSDFKLMKDVKSPHYINPTALFDAVVERDDNGAVRTIKFIQQGTRR